MRVVCRPRGHSDCFGRRHLSAFVLLSGGFMTFPAAAAVGSATSKWTRLASFLVLGGEHGVYHAGAEPVSVQSATAVGECLAEDGERTVEAIFAAARSGRAPNHGPVLLALAMAASPKHADAATNSLALAGLGEVARTAAHLKKFAGFVTAERGWGRSLRHAISRWYV